MRLDHSERQRFGFGLAAVLLISSVVSCVPDEQNAAVRRPVRSVQLTIITPHNRQIRDAFATGFSAWHEQERGTTVEINWIERGTPQCVDYVNQVFTGSTVDRKGATPDLMFGGGIADHVALASKGYCMELDVGDLDARIPERIGELPTRGEKNEWFATGLSSFGIFYNRRDCERRGIAPPEAWADLASPRFASWLGIANPEASGSHRQSMAFILQHQGWDEGWSTLMRIFANSRAMLNRSTAALDEVERGVFLAAFAVNFDGLSRVESNTKGLAYINPPGATATTPDVTSVFKTASDVQLATDFVRYCLSEPGQAIWGVRAEALGLHSATLYHYPIDREIYTKYADSLSVAENPFETDFGLILDPQRSRQLSAALIPLVRAATGENHILLQQAWERANASGMDAEQLAQLMAPPMSESEAIELGQAFARADRAGADALVAKWSETFRKRYEGVLSALGD